MTPLTIVVTGVMTPYLPSGAAMAVGHADLLAGVGIDMVAGTSTMTGGL